MSLGVDVFDARDPAGTMQSSMAHLVDGLPGMEAVPGAQPLPGNCEDCRSRLHARPVVAGSGSADTPAGARAFRVTESTGIRLYWDPDLKSWRASVTASGILA